MRLHLTAIGALLVFAVTMPTSAVYAQTRAKEVRKLFCPERSAAQRFMMVNGTNCNEVCENVFREYRCDLKQRLNEGWKVTSVAIGSMVVQRDPCECAITGTESIIERDKAEK